MCFIQLLLVLIVGKEYGPHIILIHFNMAIVLQYQ